MPPAAKVKLSITLSRDLVERIDAEASRDSELTRSGVIELWLRRAAQSGAARALEADTVRYYDSLARDEQADDEAIARASSRASKRLRYD
jgi:hypothetical protein